MEFSTPSLLDKTEQLLHDLNNLDQQNIANDSEREQIREALNAALSRIETPWETALRLIFTQVCFQFMYHTCLSSRSLDCSIYFFYYIMDAGLSLKLGL